MGDRRVARLHTSNGDIFVYTHWGGKDYPNDARMAIIKARNRWDDETYCTRIIIDHLTRFDRDSEIGAGISLDPEGQEDEYIGGQFGYSITIDLVEQYLLVSGRESYSKTKWIELYN